MCLPMDGCCLGDGSGEGHLGRQNERKGKDIRTQPGINQQLEAGRDKLAKSLRRKSPRSRRTPSRVRSPRSQGQRVFREAMVICAECCSEAREGEDRQCAWDVTTRGSLVAWMGAVWVAAESQWHALR